MCLRRAMLPFPRNLKLVQGPYSLFLQQLLNGCGNNREKLTFLNYLVGHFSVSVWVPPGLAHFVRLIYVGKINLT